MLSIMKRLVKLNPTVESLVRYKILSRVKTPEIELKWINNYFRKNGDGVAIDVGAADGYYTAVFSRVFDKVISIEPLPQHLAILNGFKPNNVFVHQLAVSNEEGSASLIIPVNRNGDFILHEAGIGLKSDKNSVAINVDTSPLDTIYSKFHDGLNVKCIKIDVEGHELSVLESAEGVIRKFHPVVICEIEYRHSVLVAKTFEYMRCLGYKSYYTIDGVNLKNIDEEMLVELQCQERLNLRCAHGKNVDGAEYVNNIIFVKE